MHFAERFLLEDIIKGTGLPDAPLPPLSAFAFLNNGCRFGGSHIGSKRECLQMLALAAERGIAPRIELMPMRECKRAVEGVRAGRPRYRYVLEQDLDA